MGRRMRWALVAGLLSVVACAPLPNPAPSSSVPAETAAIIKPTTASTAPTTTFTFDVENRSQVAVVVSVASDTAATMPGFEPGQRGTISLPLLNPTNGVSIEVQGPECRLLASSFYPTPVPFTLLVEDAPGAGSVQLSTVTGASLTPIPLPTNSLVGCGG